MSKRLFKTMVALLTIAAAAAGPAWGQNSNVSWVLTPYGDLQTGDTVVIVDKTSAKALPNNNGDSNPSAVSVTLNSAKDSLSAAPAATLKWVVVLNNGNYQFRKPGSEYYLYTNDVNTGVRVGNSNNNQFTFQIGGTNEVPFLKNTSTSRYIGVYSNQNWRCYNPIHDNIKNTVIAFYKAPTPHTVRFASGNDGWTVTDVDSARSATAPAVLENVIAGDSLVVTAPATLPGKVKSVKAVKYVPPVLVQSIVLDKQTAFLAKDSTMTLSVASVLPENAADKSYTWSSDNTSVAIVNATTGVVTGMAAGTANIIATANDGSGVKDTCVVTVLNSAILDGVTVLYASDLDRWSTITGYNPGVLYLDGDYVRLTSNGASLFYQGDRVHSIDFIYSPFDDYQWLLVTNISGANFYYRQGETWQQAIDANRPYNHDWKIEGGYVKNMTQILVDTDSQSIDPTATIDPSTVNYHLD